MTSSGKLMEYLKQNFTAEGKENLTALREVINSSLIDVSYNTSVFSTTSPSSCNAVGTLALICIMCIFITTGIVGIVGNSLVIFIILRDCKMRHSATNLLITNLALSDLIILIAGLPDVVLFVVNRGWLLGEVACKLERFVLVISLYSSVITLLTVCVERCIGIVYPIKAHILCSRKKIILVIVFIWPAVCMLGLPVILYNKPLPSGSQLVPFCGLRFPGQHTHYLMLYRYIESTLFYFIPLVVQLVCYLIIGQHLFVGSDELHRTHVAVGNNGVQRESVSDIVKARKGVIKMLLASVIIYFVSYSPHQVLLVYNTFAPAPFHQTWVFLVLVTAMSYVNSAANPILYCIFSHKFRVKFHEIYRTMACKRTAHNRQITGHSVNGISLATFRRETGNSDVTHNTRYAKSITQGYKVSFHSLPT